MPSPIQGFAPGCECTPAMPIGNLPSLLLQLCSGSHRLLLARRISRLRSTNLHHFRYCISSTSDCVPTIPVGFADVVFVVGLSHVPLAGSRLRCARSLLMRVASIGHSQRLTCLLCLLSSHPLTPAGDTAEMSRWLGTSPSRRPPCFISKSLQRSSTAMMSKPATLRHEPRVSSQQMPTTTAGRWNFLASRAAASPTIPTL